MAQDRRRSGQARHHRGGDHEGNAGRRMTDSLVDSNVLIDVAAEDPVWRAWSDEQLLLAEERGNVLVNPIIYAEIARAFDSEEKLDRWLKPSIFRRAVLPYGAGWLAAQAFAKYRKAGGTRTSPLPDFYID